MLKKTVTYTNFNDEEITEDHFFHLSKAELVELEASYDGGLSKELEQIVEKENPKDIIAMFKKLILDAYGVKSSDGTRFIKNQELREQFESSEAYSEIFMELVTDADAASQFVNGIVPKGMDQDVSDIKQKLQDKPEVPKPLEAPKGVRGDGSTTAPPRQITRAEALEMPHEELSHLLATGQGVLSSGE